MLFKADEVDSVLHTQLWYEGAEQYQRGLSVLFTSSGTTVSVDGRQLTMTGSPATPHSREHALLRDSTVKVQAVLVSARARTDTLAEMALELPVPYGNDYLLVLVRVGVLRPADVLLGAGTPMPRVRAVPLGRKRPYPERADSLFVAWLFRDRT